MTNITPDHIKSIAAEIRKTEAQRLGDKLPNTTALNAITRALGLGEDFRAFKAAHAAPAIKAAPKLLKSVVMMAFDTPDTQEEYIFDWHLKDLRKYLLEGWTVEAYESAHGFATLYFETDSAAITYDDLKAARRKFQDLARLLDRDYPDEEIGLPEYVLHWQEFDSDREICVDFVYHENKQVVSVTVNESAWKARHQASISDEDALLLLGYDNEIDPEYGSSDISFDRAYSSREYYDE